MEKIIGVTDLQRGFKRVFVEVAEAKTPYILTRDSRPEVVMVPYDAWLRTQANAEASVWQRLDAVLARLAERNAAVSDAELAADIATARREARPKRRMSPKRK